MAVVSQLSDWTRRDGEPTRAQQKRRHDGTAEIHILPCIRREAIAPVETTYEERLDPTG